MACVFEDFRTRWALYFEARARGDKVTAQAALRREAVALMQQEDLNPAQLARHLKLPDRLVYQWQAAKKNKSKKSKKFKKACFYPVGLAKSKATLALHTPRGYELHGLELSSLRQWIEQGVL